MTLEEKLDPISELSLIKLKHELSYEELTNELRNYLGLTTTALYRLMARGTASRSQELAVEIWLKRIGRKRYPLEKGKILDLDIQIEE